MDQEIDLRDLRPFLVALLRRWRLFIICAIGLAFITGTIQLARTLIFRSASADILIVPSSSQVNLDPRFQTTNSNQASNPTDLRQGLLSLASNRTLAEKVVKDLGVPDLTEDELNQQIKVLTDGDLLRISVSNKSADLALQIVQAWSKAYENLVIDVYSGSQFHNNLLALEIDLAQKRYDQAQATLEKFLLDGQYIKEQQQISTLTDLLAGSRQSEQQLYTDYLERSRQIEQILQDAQTLRDQADTQGTSKFTNSFASLMLRIRMVGGTAPVFRMTAADLTTSETDPSNLSANLAQLIKVLSLRRDQLLAQSNDVANAIASGGLIPIGFDAATRQRYIDQLADLNGSYERLQSQQSILTQQRDLARDVLTLLQRKQAELQVAQSSPQIEVRFIGASIDPLRDLITQVLLSAVVAAILGLVMGAVIALLLDTIIPAIRRLMSSDAAQPAARSDTSADSAAQSS